jgi:putative DNA primase/helicase
VTTTTLSANGKAAFYSDPSAKPGVSAVICDSIPPEMRAERRWLLWRLEWVEDKKGKGKWSKVPYQSNGRKASSTDAKTWTPFETAVGAYRSGGFDGIGFVLGDGWAGVDLDDVAH